MRPRRGWPLSRRLTAAHASNRSHLTGVVLSAARYRSTSRKSWPVTATYIRDATKNTHAPRSERLSRAGKNNTLPQMNITPPMGYTAVFAVSHLRLSRALG